MWSILEDRKASLEIELRRQGHKLEIELATIQRTLKLADQKNILNEIEVDFTRKKLAAYFNSFDELEKKFYVKINSYVIFLFMFVRN